MLAADSSRIRDISFAHADLIEICHRTLTDLPAPCASSPMTPSFSEGVVHDVVETLSTNPSQSGDMQSQQQANQVQYEEESMVSTQSMMQPALTQHHSSLAHDLQEQMFQVLFTSTGRQQEDTTACSRRHERTAEDYNAMLARGWLSRQHCQLSTPFHP
ncbi:uncharacterized protein UDID_17432 [Ustilago sp. UG-2017a]|nr:uncharacterized protein UDID_17432 [Ustilago sp. UG-2017a]